MLNAASLGKMGRLHIGVIGVAFNSSVMERAWDGPTGVYGSHSYYPPCLPPYLLISVRPGLDHARLVQQYQNPVLPAGNPRNSPGGVAGPTCYSLFAGFKTSRSENHKMKTIR